MMRSGWGAGAAALAVLACGGGGADRSVDAAAAAPPAAARPGADTVSARAVAITFDDLPASQSGDLERIRGVTDRLLAAIRAHGVPAVGFVNEIKLEVPGEREARTGLLRRWVDAGLELGNHTYSHLAVTAAPLERVREDVVRGEPVTRALLAEREMRLRWFRHPQLRTGADAATRSAYARFLADRGYTVAPVTFDNQEWVFAGAYHRARSRGDSAAARCVAEAYVPYMERTFAFFEELSREVVGREIPQVLLLHANELNADHFGALAAALRRRGYRFVTLDQALADSAYRLPDGYTGPRGPSWLHRWGVAMGRPMRPEPREPALIAALADERGAPSARVPADCSALEAVSGPWAAARAARQTTDGAAAALPDTTIQTYTAR
ncbi:MAG TPA: polysaccharide deacetylase family protein [Longimicrobiaceae bacterium]|nr:polysaccharide deacetylase family protein [Longimicrobiaceae bacterium]